jgi:hypothetical protein
MPWTRKRQLLSQLEKFINGWKNPKVRKYDWAGTLASKGERHKLCGVKDRL